MQLSDQSNPSKDKREYKVLSPNKKNILNLSRSGTLSAKVGCKVGKKESSIPVLKWKEAEIYGRVSAAPTAANMVSLVHDKVVAKIESIKCVAR